MKNLILLTLILFTALLAQAQAGLVKLDLNSAGINGSIMAPKGAKTELSPVNKNVFYVSAGPTFRVRCEINPKYKIQESIKAQKEHYANKSNYPGFVKYIDETPTSYLCESKPGHYEFSVFIAYQDGYILINPPFTGDFTTQNLKALYDSAKTLTITK
jgi:hypothetical protein